MMGLGWQELVIVLVIVVIIFGAGKLPEIGGAFGKSIKEFKKESETEGGEIAKTSVTSEPSNPVVTKVQAPTAEPVQSAREVRADEI